MPGSLQKDSWLRETLTPDLGRASVGSVHVSRDFCSFRCFSLVVSFYTIHHGDSEMSAICRQVALLSRLHFPKERLSCNLSLYLVANRPSFQDECLFFSKIQEAVRGGVSCVQLRDHRSDFSTSLKIAIRLKEMLGSTPLFINTLEPVKTASAVGAEGIYLEEGGSPAEARRILGEKAMIGVPVKTLDEVNAAGQTNVIDYLSVKLFPSKRTCAKNDALWGIEGLEEVRRLSSHRIVAIGGLDWKWAATVYRLLRSDDGIAMAGGLMGEDDPCLTAQRIQAMRQKNVRPT